MNEDYTKESPIESRTIETITLTRDSYDRLKDKIYLLKNDINKLDQDLAEKEVELFTANDIIEKYRNIIIKDILIKDIKYDIKQAKTREDLEKLLNEKYFMVSDVYEMCRNYNIDIEHLKCAIELEWYELNPDKDILDIPFATLDDEE